MDNTLTKEIVAKTIADAMLNIFEAGNFDFSKIVNSESAVIANKEHAVLDKYSFYNEHNFDEEMDFKAIEDIIHIFEEHGYTGGSIHDF